MLGVWIDSTVTIGGDAVYTKIYLTPSSAGYRRFVELSFFVSVFEIFHRYLNLSLRSNSPHRWFKISCFAKFSSAQHILSFMIKFHITVCSR